jgi:hypothetical protein
MTANRHVPAVVKIRWKNDIPPTLKGGGWESSMDGGATWKAVNQKEVNQLTSTQLVLWN